MRTTALDGVELRRSNPLSQKHALWIAGGLAQLASIAHAEAMPCGGLTNRWYVVWLPADSQEQDATRRAFAEFELRKAVQEGEAFAWTPAASTHLIQTASCYNPGTGGTYRVTRRLNPATGELVHTCDCMRHRMSKLPCKHILDGILRERFQTLGYALPEPVAPLDPTTFSTRRKADFD